MMLTRVQLARWLKLPADECDRLLELLEVTSDASGMFDVDLVADAIQKKNIGRRVGQKGVVSTQKEVARAFGVSVHTVRKDWRQRGMPGQPGCWDLEEIARWKAIAIEPPPQDVGSKPAELVGSPHDAEINDWLFRRREAEARLKEAQATAAERENRIAEANVCYRPDVEQHWALFFVELKRLLLAMPEQLKPRFPHDQADIYAAEVATQARSVLEELSRFRPVPPSKDDVLPT